MKAWLVQRDSNAKSQTMAAVAPFLAKYTDAVAHFDHHWTARLV